MIDDEAEETGTEHAAPSPEAIEAAPPVSQPVISLKAYAELRRAEHWLIAALRTECPIEQHMKHGRKNEHHAEYLAHTDAHGKTAAEWDKLAHAITHRPMGNV